MTQLGALLEGNKRYRAGRAQEIEEGRVHQPKAVVLTCSDARVSPELIFDARVGELFVVRIPGCALLEPVIESVQFAATHLNPQLVVVLGHERCAAIDAFRDGKGNILPHLCKNFPKKIMETETLEEGVKLSVTSIVKKLAGLVELEVVGAYYSVESGEVTIL